MSFTSVFNALPMSSLLSTARESGRATVDAVMQREGHGLGDFATLLAPAAAERLEDLGRRSQAMTRQRFGKVIRLFAPLYLSNECINNCQYCGFSRDNPILRVTLSIDDVVREARELQAQGFRNVLLVAGEHPKFVSTSYLRECVAAVHREAPGVSLEVGPMETAEYRPLVEAGAEGLVVYQVKENSTNLRA